MGSYLHALRHLSMRETCLKTVHDQEQRVPFHQIPFVCHSRGPISASWHLVINNISCTVRFRATIKVAHKKTTNLIWRAANSKHQIPLHSKQVQSQMTTFLPVFIFFDNTYIFTLINQSTYDARRLHLEIWLQTFLFNFQMYFCDMTPLTLRKTDMKNWIYFKNNLTLEQNETEYEMHGCWTRI